MALAKVTAVLQGSQDGSSLLKVLQAFQHSLLCTEGCSTAEATAGTLTSDHQAERSGMKDLSQYDAKHSRPQPYDDRLWASHGPIRQWLYRRETGNEGQGKQC